MSKNTHELDAKDFLSDEQKIELYMSSTPRADTCESILKELLDVNKYAIDPRKTKCPITKSIAAIVSRQLHNLISSLSAENNILILLINELIRSNQNWAVCRLILITCIDCLGPSAYELLNPSDCTETSHLPLGSLISAASRCYTYRKYIDINGKNKYRFTGNIPVNISCMIIDLIHMGASTDKVTALDMCQDIVPCYWYIFLHACNDPFQESPRVYPPITLPKPLFRDLKKSRSESPIPPSLSPRSRRISRALPDADNTSEHHFRAIESPLEANDKQRPKTSPIDIVSAGSLRSSPSMQNLGY